MARFMAGLPEGGEYAGGFGNYIRLIADTDVLSFLEAQLNEFMPLLAGLSDEESLVRHPPFTWSIRQVVGHMNDCERIFGCRALRIARNDPTPLPSFDQDDYVLAANFDRVPLGDLVSEFELLRKSHICLFRQFDAGAWTRRGTVSGNPMSARAMVYAIAGHAKHHIDIVARRLSSHPV